MVKLWVDEQGRIIAEIRNLYKGYVNPFEDAIKKSKSELQKKLKLEEDLMDGIIEQFKTDYDDNVGSSTITDTELNYRTVGCVDSIYETNLYLDALSEMEIVYLYKSLEIYLKTVIKIAYPEIETKSFYQFAKMTAFFKSKSIEIDKLQGYREFSDLGKVNNSIKHSSLLSNDVKEISEFKGKREHDSLSLDSFHDRVKLKIELFKENIAEEVIKVLFEFNN